MRRSFVPDPATTPVPPRPAPAISEISLTRPSSLAGSAGTYWRLLESCLGRWALRLGALIWLLAAQAALLLSPAGGVPDALATGVRLGLGTWVVFTLLAAGAAMLRASLPDGPREPIVAGSVPPWSGAPAVAVVSCLAIFALTFGSTGRLAVTLTCFLVLSLALSWAVGRAAGGRAAARAVAALGVFAAFAAGADLRATPRTAPAEAGSAYRWTTGWPTEDWVLRHEIRPDRPPPPHGLLLKIALAAPYDGPSRVYVALNGHQLGPARLAGHETLESDLPADLVAGQARLVLDLRQLPPDPRLRITAERWGQAATAGPGASSHFDGARWWPGTFDDAFGRHQAGNYVLQLDPAT